MKLSWDQTDLLACAAYNATGLRKKPVKPGTFNPLRAAREPPPCDLNHETCPEIYYAG